MKQAIYNFILNDEFLWIVKNKLNKNNKNVEIKCGLVVV